MKLGLFFRKLALLLLLIIFLDFFIGHTLRYFYFTEKSGVHFRLTRALEHVNQDLLIFGSSRANHHYVSQVWEHKWGKSFCNVGEDGQGIFYHLAVLRAVLKRYSPKAIVLDFNISDFYKTNTSYDRLSALLPYYASHPEVRDIVNLKNKFEKLKLFSQIYPFNSAILTIIVGNLEMNKQRRGDDRGYIPLYKEWKSPLQNELVRDVELDYNKVRAYENFITEAKLSGVKVCIVVSPYYLALRPHNLSIDLARSIAMKHNAEFFDYSRDCFFIEHPELFNDEDHLNHKGAQIFSTMVIDEVQQALGLRS